MHVRFCCFFRAPSDVILKPLSAGDADMVDDEWPNKHIGSRFLVKRLIEWNPNIGAFDRNNELMAWSLRLQTGPLGALQVRKKYMRRGIGSLVALAMCKILANNNMDTFALVGLQNFASINMFAKLGFKHADDVYWLRTFPVDEKFEWCDDT